jgi:hypothetical protein
LDDDIEADLALLKIDAECATVLRLADSNTVPLAEEILVIGFPLSDLLGESLKISRGEISGRVAGDSSPRFQTDATLNPGNSGGPVVNHRGEAVGVASAFLTGARINNVGMVIPSNLVRKLLETHELKLKAGDTGVSAMDGPDLVRSVQDGVAFILVESLPEAAAASVEFTANYQQIGRQGTREGSSGTLRVNSNGETFGVREDVSMPYFLGQLADFCLEYLPDDKRRNWERHRTVRRHRQPQDELERYRRLTPGFGLRANVTQPVEPEYIDGDEHCLYEVQAPWAGGWKGAF